jgi:AcrR family transcriptional regulator
MIKISDVELNERRAAVVQAATEVFLRYGYARTTMVDLAAAARVSRPTLYELFPGKEQIFAAVVQGLSQNTLQHYRELLPKLRTLRTKLHRFCGDWGTHGLRLIERHPDAKDLFNLEVPAVREMYEDFIRFLIEVIAGERNTSRIPLNKLVRNLVFSLRGLKDAAADVRQMEEMIALQVDIFLEAL